MAKERASALLVMALANGVAMYVAVVVKLNHLHPPLPSLQALSSEHQPSCFGLEEEGVSGGRAAANRAGR